MTIAKFISIQPQDRQDILAKIHLLISTEDKSVESKIGTMMGKEMILYNTPGSFKYGLSSIKKHISLHAMPIYCSIDLHSKYKTLFPKATFQKGCINFLNENDLPLNTLRELLAECSKVDLTAIRSEQLKSRKK